MPFKPSTVPNVAPVLNSLYLIIQLVDPRGLVSEKHPLEQSSHLLLSSPGLAGEPVQQLAPSPQRSQRQARVPHVDIPAPNHQDEAQLIAPLHN